MKNLFLFIFFAPFLSVCQNIVDDNSMKQGAWLKKYENGMPKYEGVFKDNVPQGVFKYFYQSGELKATKEFFHKGKAAASHFFDI